MAVEQALNTDNDSGDVLITYASGASTILDSLDLDLHCRIPSFPWRRSNDGFAGFYPLRGMALAPTPRPCR